MSINNNQLDNVLYKALRRGLESTTGDNFPECLIYLNYSHTEIDKKRDGVCVCGKQGLKYLHYFSYYNDNNNNSISEIIIGNNCFSEINSGQFEFNIWKHLYNINVEIEQWKKENNNNKCLRCGEYNIKKDYNYNKEHRKILCGDCVKTKNYIDYIKCIDCNKYRALEKSNYNNKYKLRCSKCWYIKNIKNKKNYS